MTMHTDQEPSVRPQLDRAPLCTRLAMAFGAVLGLFEMPSRDMALTRAQSPDNATSSVLAARATVVTASAGL